MMPAHPVPPPPTGRRWRWRRDDYHRIGDLGLFAESRVELVGGEILAMRPRTGQRRVATERGRRALARIFPEDTYTIWDQEPLALGEWDEPEPDLAVTVGQPDDYLLTPPMASQAVLVVEVADSTIRHDLGDKADRYAAAGVTDYWVVDLPARMIEVCRVPRPDQASGTGVRYAERRRHGPGEAIEPLAAPGRPILVADILPGA